MQLCGTAKGGCTTGITNDSVKTMKDGSDENLGDIWY